MKLLNLEQFLMTVKITHIHENVNMVYFKVHHIEFSYPYDLYIQAEFSNVFDDIYNEYIECFDNEYIECFD